MEASPLARLGELGHDRRRLYKNKRVKAAPPGSRGEEARPPGYRGRPRAYGTSRKSARGCAASGAANGSSCARFLLLSLAAKAQRLSHGRQRGDVATRGLTPTFNHRHFCAGKLHILFYT